MDWERVAKSDAISLPSRLMVSIRAGGTAATLGQPDRGLYLLRHLHFDLVCPARRAHRHHRHPDEGEDFRQQRRRHQDHDCPQECRHAFPFLRLMVTGRKARPKPCFLLLLHFLPTSNLAREQSRAYAAHEFLTTKSCTSALSRSDGNSEPCQEREFASDTLEGGHSGCEFERAKTDVTGGAWSATIST